MTDSAVADVLEQEAERSRRPVVVTNRESLSDQSDTVTTALMSLQGDDAVYGRGDDIVQVAPDPGHRHRSASVLEHGLAPGGG